MPRSPVLSSIPRSWLVLGVLLLVPLSASAQRRGSRQMGLVDPLCEDRGGEICQKIRVGLVGGGIFTSEGAVPGGGIKGGLTWGFGPIEAGLNMLVMSDLRTEEGNSVGAGEGILRIAFQRGRWHSILAEIGGGVSLSDDPETEYRTSFSGSTGLTVEWSAPGVGVFVTTGLSVIRSHRWLTLPHVGAGLQFNYR